MAPRWGPAETDRLDYLAGNVPFPLIPAAYNQWAIRQGYQKRTANAIHQRARRQRLTTRVFGDWLTTGVIAKTLGVASSMPRRWICSEGLPATQLHHGAWRPWYVRRSDLVALARRRPELFGGIEPGRLVQLLENERLADTIAAAHTRRANTPKRVHCVEMGRTFVSIRDAARTVFVSRQLIQIAIRTGARAAGYHWAWAE
jgi:hypothetical protein